MRSGASGAGSASDGGGSQQNSLTGRRAGECGSTKGGDAEGGGKGGKWRLLTSVGAAADLLSKARPTFRCYRELTDIQPLAQVSAAGGGARGVRASAIPLARILADPSPCVSSTAQGPRGGGAE